MTERGVGDISEGEYAERLVKGVVDHLPTINSSIEGYAQGWDLDRMPAIDRAVAQIATYEILYESSVDDSVAISEAMLLASEMSTESSKNYLNGLLGRIAAVKEALL